MLRARSILTSVLAGTLAATSLAGCGGKNKADGDFEPPPAVAANPAAPVAPPPVEPPAPPKNAEPKTPGSKGEPMPPDAPLPAVPPPIFSGAKDPPAKEPPMPFVPPPMPDRPAPTVEKKDPDKPFEWPTSLYGRPMSEFIKDINDNDPAIREMALRTVPAFGPASREPATKFVLWHMDFVNEKDPGVRAAAYEAIGILVQYGKDGGLDKEADTTEAIRLLYTSADRGGGIRLHAVQTLASFGSKAEVAIPYLVGQNMTVLEPAYETRRTIASTLGAIGFNKETGPSAKALHCLSDVLVKDRSAAVRLAAYQSIVSLGPPLLHVPPPPPGQPKPAPKVDEKAVEGYVKSIKTRLLPYKAEVGSKERESPTGFMERDRQVEIFARLALMRLDPKEVNDDNLSGIAKYIATPGNDSGPKRQALNALGLMGEASSRKISEVLRALEDENPSVVTEAVTTLVMMGKEGKPAIEFLEKLKLRGSKKDEKDAKDLPKEYYADLATRAIKAINEAKPPVLKP